MSAEEIILREAENWFRAVLQKSDLRPHEVSLFAAIAEWRNTLEGSSILKAPRTPEITPPPMEAIRPSNPEEVGPGEYVFDLTKEARTQPNPHPPLPAPTTFGGAIRQGGVGTAKTTRPAPKDIQTELIRLTTLSKDESES